MDIHLAVQKVEERFDYEGNELSTEAWNTIRAFIAEALKPSHNNAMDAICPACKDTGVVNHGVDGLSFCGCAAGERAKQHQ